MRAGAQARRAERASTRFDRLDADKNGQISRAEFDAARPDERAAHRGRVAASIAASVWGAGGGQGQGPGQQWPSTVRSSSPTFRPN
jgi:hypothetical protein